MHFHHLSKKGIIFVTGTMGEKYILDLVQTESLYFAIEYHSDCSRTNITYSIHCTGGEMHGDTVKCTKHK